MKKSLWIIVCLAASIQTCLARDYCAHCCQNSPDPTCDQDCQFWISTTITNCTQANPPLFSACDDPFAQSCYQACENKYPFPGCKNQKTKSKR